MLANAVTLKIWKLKAARRNVAEIISGVNLQRKLFILSLLSQYFTTDW